MRRILKPFVLLLMLAGGHAQSAENVLREPLETEFNASLSLLVSGDDDGAGKAMAAIIRKHPEFRLAQMIQGDLYAARAGGKPLLPSQAGQRKLRIADMMKELKARYGYRPAYDGKMPDTVLRLSSIYPYALLFDADESRLYLLRNHKDGPRLVGDYYASYGRNGMDKRDEGDNRTPTGVYRVGHIYADEELPELYGDGAYTLNYPNRWDRLRGHSGGGIWLHGVPRITYSRPPRASRGCIVISNDTIARLREINGVESAPVVLSDQVQWLQRKEWLSYRKTLTGALRAWQEDWQSLDVEKYLAHYSTAYRDEKFDYEGMLASVRHNAKAKTSIRVGIKNLDLMLYSRQPNVIFVARFDQDYQSNNYSVAYRKQQMWRLQDGEWKIVFEGRS